MSCVQSWPHFAAQTACNPSDGGGLAVERAKLGKNSDRLATIRRLDMQRALWSASRQVQAWSAYQRRAGARRSTAAGRRLAALNASANRPAIAQRGAS